MFRKMYTIIKNNIVSFVIGLVLFLAIGGVVAATTYNSVNVGYNLTNSSKITSNTVKGALDQLFTRASKYKKYYYAFGDPTTSSPIDYSTLGHSLFIRVSEDNIGTDNKEMCVVRNGELGCFKNGAANWASNQYLIQAFFSDLTCSTGTRSGYDYVQCTDDSYDCFISSNEYLEFDVDDDFCTIRPSGVAFCG